MYNSMDPNELIKELPYLLQMDVLSYCFDFLSD